MASASVRFLRRHPDIVPSLPKPRRIRSSEDGERPAGQASPRFGAKTVLQMSAVAPLCMLGRVLWLSTRLSKLAAG